MQSCARRPEMRPANWIIGLAAAGHSRSTCRRIEVEYAAEFGRAGVIALQYELLQQLMLWGADKVTADMTLCGHVSPIWRHNKLDRHGRRLLVMLCETLLTCLYVC